MRGACTGAGDFSIRAGSTINQHGPRTASDRSERIRRTSKCFAAIDTTSCICTCLLGDLPPARRALSVGHCNAKQRRGLAANKTKKESEAKVVHSLLTPNLGIQSFSGAFMARSNSQPFTTPSPAGKPPGRRATPTWALIFCGSSAILNYDLRQFLADFRPNLAVKPR